MMERCARLDEGNEEEEEEEEERKAMMKKMVYYERLPVCWYNSHNFVHIVVKNKKSDVYCYYPKKEVPGLI
jgi:hypothetical protein